MNAVARAEEHLPAETEPSALQALIERMASDPTGNVEALERLLALQERVDAKNAERAFAEAMNEAQRDLGPVATDAANPSTKSRYASYLALDRAIRPVYSKHGFSLSFGTGEALHPETVRITCRVAHRGGHAVDYHVDMPADGKGAKGNDVMTKTHATGAALSYGQRYLLKLIFNIAVGEDTDGNAPTGPREASSASVKATETINLAQTCDDLRDWRDKHAEGVKGLVNDREWAALMELWNKRFAALKAKASGQ